MANPTSSDSKVVSLTEKAVEKIRRQLEKDEMPGGCLRIKVSAGGCSGMNYEFEFVKGPEFTDEISETDGVTVAIDPKAVALIKGSTLDWHQTLMEAGFRITNPNATASCNCGTSFSTF
ncbi:MAG: iron-sulfur cluster assembly accessory protein [Elusimicrobia bacterium]|nr:MAG: iron-sulfur cluster assembly accessory protein [Elusimicrobiota bacterium]